jgi:hypothetical protein
MCLVALLLPSLGAAAQASTAEDVRKKIAELKLVLDAFDGKASVASDVSDLRKRLLDKKLVGDAPDAFGQYSDEVQTLLKDKESSQQIFKKAGPSVTQLSAALDAMFADAALLDEFPGRLAKVTSLITASAANRLLIVEALADKDKSKPIPKAREAFDGAWASVTDDYKIHVIKSWFGDLRTKWAEGRLCTSTLAVKTPCEGQPSCKPLQDGTAPAQFNQEILCGFDPAPLVDSRFKGVVIEYACVRGGKDTWDRVAAHPGDDPVTENAWAPRDIYQVVVRSSGMSIRCPFPVKPGD